MNKKIIGSTKKHVYIMRIQQKYQTRMFWNCSETIILKRAGSTGHSLGGSLLQIR